MVDSVWSRAVTPGFTLATRPVMLAIPTQASPPVGRSNIIVYVAEMAACVWSTNTVVEIPIINRYVARYCCDVHDACRTESLILLLPGRRMIYTDLNDAPMKDGCLPLRSRGPVKRRCCGASMRDQNHQIALMQMLNNALIILSLLFKV